jgi:hypothetical protein
MIVEPSQYLLAATKDDLRVIRKALGQWRGPYDPDDIRTPTERQYQEEGLKRAAEIEKEIGKHLKR